jgi:hypothetical protein
MIDVGFTATHDKKVRTGNSYVKAEETRGEKDFRLT